MKKVVFLDRDGTLIVEPPDEQIDSFEKLELIPGVIQGLRLLIDRGFELVMVSNQDALGSARYPLEAFEGPHNKLLGVLKGEGISFSQIFICPHTPADNCGCRKPKTGLVDQYIKSNDPDLGRSFVVGDRETDVQFGLNVGCKSVRLSDSATSAASYVAPDFLEACRYMVRADRSAHVERSTNETSITVDVVLDGTGSFNIQTGVGFFDHMLAQLSKHSLIDIDLAVKGDLHVDEHHTVDDTAIALGEAFHQALGNKKGIERYGFVLPMDDCLATVAIDFGGRPWLVWDAEFKREKIGELPTEMFFHFFKSFSDGARCNLNIKAEGANEHHKIEAIFKALSRAIRMAIRRDINNSELPSTKGML